MFWLACSGVRNVLTNQRQKLQPFQSALLDLWLPCLRRRSLLVGAVTGQRLRGRSLSRPASWETLNPETDNVEISMWTHNKISLTSVQLRWCSLGNYKLWEATISSFFFWQRELGPCGLLMEVTSCVNQPAWTNLRTTCRRLWLALSLAGLPSEPLLLPDCSFSFKSAVAYAKVSCRVWREHKESTQQKIKKKKKNIKRFYGDGLHRRV